ARNRDQPVTNLRLTLFLSAWQRRKLHLSDHFRLRRIAERTDPGGPVDRHRGRPLQQVCTDVARVETHVTGRRIFAELEHELKCRDTFRTVDGRLSTRVKHLAAEGPEDR